MIQDLKFALRSLVRQRTLGLMVIALLALGIAGNTAIFSVYNGLFLRPLPYHEPERLLDLDEVAPKWNLEYVGIAYPDFHVWRQENRAFDGMAVWNDNSYNFSHRGEARRVDGIRATHDLLEVLGLQPALGRGFTPEEDKPGGAKVALLGHGFWQRQFGGDREALGETLRLDNESYTVVGVLPPEAAFPEDADVWVPLAGDPAEKRGWYLDGVGRLKAGVTVAQALDDLTRVHKGMIEKREVNETTSPRLEPLRDRYLGDYRVGSAVLLGGVGVVLLIACVNVAGLMLARATARTREMGIRAAIGATRSRIMRQLLTESLLLAAAGGLAGVGLGYVFLRALRTVMPDGLPVWVVFEPDGRIIAFCILVSGASAVLFGLAPAIRAARVDVQRALHETSSRATAGAGRRSSLKLLVVGEVALAVILLVSAGLLLQAYRKVLDVDPGYQAHNVLTYRLSLPNVPYDTDEKRIRFYETWIERQRALPGVEAAGGSSSPPLGGHWGNFFEVEGAPPLGPDEQDPVILQRVVLPGYLDTVGIELVRGRFFTDDDGRTEGSRAIVVNETFANRFWPGENPLGKRVRHRGEDNPWMTVVGVNRDTKHYGLDQEMRPGVHVPHRQVAWFAWLAFTVRTSVDPASLVAPIRRLLRELDPDLPMFDTITMSERLDESLALRRSYAGVFLAFAGVALLMALAGIYGVLSYVVSRRTHEIGIRMALGAQQGQVLRHILAEGMQLVIIGAALGAAASVATSRLLETLLFGVSSYDPVTYALVIAVLLTIALLANLLPARRAASINPTDALRFE